MKRFKKILVATDTRLDKHPILEEAAEIARQNQATLKIIDVVPEFSWLAKRATEDPEHVRELLKQEKNAKLETLAAAIGDTGVEVTTHVLAGKTAVEIIRAVMLGEHDLVMAVSKGRNSKRTGTFGQTATRLLRQCPCAVWLVVPGTTPKFKHILGCVDPSSDHVVDTELNDKVLELASTISQYNDSRFSILHAWFMDDESILGAHVQSGAIELYIKNAGEYTAKLYNKFLGQHDLSTDSDNVHLIRGEVSGVISSFVSEQGVDLIVMGTVARSGLLGMIMGNTAEKILDRISCSVLALKPYDFKSPIKAN